MLTAFAGDDYAAWLRTIQNTHERRITVTVTDLDHRPVATLTPRYVDGEVTVDVTRTPTRVLTMQLLDPSRSLQFEPDSPSAVPLQFSRMIRVGWSVRVPALNRWITCPVFWGRLTDFDREGALVSITAGGKEVMSMGQAGAAKKYPKKTKKTDVIRQLLRAGGETRTAIPDLPATLPDPGVQVRVMDSRWPHAQKVASSMDRVLFYDARGVAQLRVRPSRPSFTFNATNLASDVSIDRDPEGLRNRWIVLGPKPTGKKARVGVDIRLPAGHSMSPQSLGRALNPAQPNQREPFFLIEQVENSNIKNKAEAMAKAKRLRDDGLRTLTTYSFDALPIPHLEEHDLVRVATNEGTFLVRMRQWTLPLGLENSPTMSVGSIKRTTLARRRPKGRRGGKGGRGGSNGQNGQATTGANPVQW
jgi:hypothetical protein